MLNTILVPIDFSAESINALRTALDIAKQKNYQVIMLHNIAESEKKNSGRNVGSNSKVIDSNNIEDCNDELLDCLEELRGLRIQYHIPRLKVNFMAAYNLDIKEFYHLMEKRHVGIIILGKKLKSNTPDFQLGRLRVANNTAEQHNSLVLATNSYFSKLRYDKLLLKVGHKNEKHKLFNLLTEFASVLDMNVFVKEDDNDQGFSENKVLQKIEQGIKNDHIHLIDDNPELSDDLSEIIGDAGIDLAAALNASDDSNSEIDQLPVHRIGYAQSDFKPSFV